MTRVEAYTLTRAQRRSILAHARRAAPLECCGLIVGRGRTCLALMPAVNVSRRPATRFEVDPVAHIALRRALRERAGGLAVIGAYHSHPASAPVLSDRDRTQAHYAPWLHVIAGRRQSRFVLRAYVLDQETPVRVVLEGPSDRRR